MKKFGDKYLIKKGKLKNNNYIIYNFEKFIPLYGDWGLGMGVWGLGIGDWAQSPIPNPQSPIPNPHSINNNSDKI